MKANDESTTPRAQHDEPACEDSPKVIAAREIFAGAREICIEHDGEIYRLRITRRNKLILQK